MKYYARFSVISENYGLMGVESADFEAEDLEELVEEVKQFYLNKETKTTIFLIDEMYNEEGEPQDLEPFII